MNIKNLIGIGAVAVVAYYLFRDKKKVEVSDLKKEPSNVIPPIVKESKNQLLLSDLSSNSQGPTGIGDSIKVRRARLILDEIKVPPKEPIYINPSNLIPNVYDRGVGAEINLAASGELQGFDQYMSETCTEDIQNACKCARENNEKYLNDIPQLP